MAKEARTVDITPTWRSIMPILILAIENGTDKGRAAAEQELYRLAGIVDEMNKKAKSPCQ